MSTDTVTDYKAARDVINSAPEGTAVYRKAQEVVAELGPLQVTYKFPCMLCGAELDHTVAVEDAADWTGHPRGICGKH